MYSNWWLGMPLIWSWGFQLHSWLNPFKFLFTGIMPIPAVAASFSIPEAPVTKSESSGTSKCLDTSALKSCLSEDKLTHHDSMSSSLGRSASLHSRPGHVSVLAESKSGDQISNSVVSTCPLESGESSTILTRSTCSLHSDTRTTLSQQSLSINSKGKEEIYICESLKWAQSFGHQVNKM